MKSNYIMKMSLKIGDLTAEVGTKKFGYLKVKRAASMRTFVFKTVIGPPRPRTVMIPIMIINGSKPGPTFCITAGTHACEYAGIAAEIKIYKQTNPENLKGKLIIVPVVNPASFWTRTPYVNLQDGMDISAAYGREGTTISYAIAKTMLEEVLSKADYIFDIHAGDILEDYYPRTGFARIGDDEVDAGSEMLAKTFGLEVISEHTIPPEKTLIGKSALRKPQAMAEVGCCGKLETRYVDMAFRGITNIMKKLDMIEGKPILPDKQTRWQSGDFVFTESTGIFYSNVKAGEIVKQGQLLGEIGNIQGDTIEKLIAPHDGMIILEMYNPVKHHGDLVFKIFKQLPHR